MGKIKKILTLFLAVIFILPTAAGCASGGKKLMTLDKTSFSVNIFMYYLSQRKGQIVSSISGGSAALTDSYWDTVVSEDGKTTRNDIITAEVIELVKTKLAAVSTFDNMGLKLEKADFSAIDEEIAELIEFDANGSKNEFNKMLSNYGINVKILREIMVMELKIERLAEHLYGKGGSKIADNVMETYYLENYVRFKQVFIYTHDFVWVKDKFGTVVWYKEDGTVSYDLDGIATGEEDDDGNTIYYDESGKIAYRKANAERKHEYDENGQEKTVAFSADKIKELVEKAEDIKSQAIEGSEASFNALIEEHNEDKGLTAYPNGFYVSRDSVYDKNVLTALFEMKNGEVRLVHSDLGIHVLMRYPAEEGGYALETNQDFFVDAKTETYHFMPQLVDKLFKAYLSEKISEIQIDKKLLEGTDMKSVGANYYY